MWNAIFNRFSLRTVLVLYILVPLLFAMAAISYLGLRNLENILEKRMQEDVQLVARAIRLPLSYSLEKERYGSVNQALQSVFHIERVYGAYVYDVQGRRVAALGAVEPDREQFDLLQKVESGEREGQYEEIQGRRVYSYFVPLFDTSEKSIGLLQVIRRKIDFEPSISWLRYGVTASISFMGLCLSGLVLLG
ncbi:MAG: two-component sensor histidine kinase, partial [Desulfohalobiaceae bacterium]|nr:two-component sensor histidine kinase [Desulfohalobiaceae bacterium]